MARLQLQQLDYNTDFSGTYTTRSLVDKDYVDSINITSGEGLTGGGTIGSGLTLDFDFPGLSAYNLTGSDIDTDLVSLYHVTDATHYKYTINEFFQLALLTLNGDTGSENISISPSTGAFNDIHIVGDASIDTSVGVGAPPTVTVSVNEAGVDHDSLLNYVANEHIDWTINQGATNINVANITSLTVSNFSSPNISQWTNDSGYITTADWTLQGDTGSATISPGETVDHTGGEGIVTTAASGSPNTVTYDLDFAGLTLASGDIDPDADYLAFYDVTATTHKTIIGRRLLHSDGNVLWVSKSGGNNTTAAKGDMHRPYADPWAARDDASNGDLIIVLEGSWSFGQAASGADVEGTLSDDLNLFDGFTEIYYHFCPGTELTGSGFTQATGTDSDLASLFATDLALTAKVTGHLKIVWPSVQLHDVITIRNSSAKIDFELDYISWGQFGIKYYEADTLNVKIKEAEQLAPALALLSLRADTSNPGPFTDNKINLDIDYVHSSNSTRVTTMIFSTQCCSTTVDHTNLQLNINVGNAFKSEQVDPSGSDVAQFFCLVHDSHIQQSTINCNIGTAYYESTNPASIPDSGGDFHTHNKPQSLFMVGSSRLDGSIVNINVGSCISDYEILHIIGGTDTRTGSEEYSYINVDGHFRCRETWPIILESISGAGNGDYVKINLSGTWIAEQKPVLSDDRGADEEAEITLTGNFITEAASTPVFAIRYPIAIKNATLINDGTHEDIVTDNGVDTDILVMGAYSNTLAVHADIVERISPIVRDTNVRI